VTDLRSAVLGATQRLAEAGIASAESDALLLAAHALGTDVGDVRKAMVLGGVAPAAYEDLVEARASRLPLQHLTGRAGFRGLELEVGPGVFVPRPETEVVAGLAIDAARASGGAPVVVDLCTGSGAIALSVKDEVPAAQVYAVELSELAHAWAVRNRERTGLAVEVRLGDAAQAFPELDGQVDVVVSNPPYIPVGAVPLDPEVRDHDPEVALYGGSEDGLAIPLVVAARAAALLRPGGVLVMEHADTQGASLPAALLATGLWRDVRDELDLTERPRATVATRT
jgi:release factor glutamine methyltransferase